MPVIKAVALWTLCVIDLTIGAYHAWEIGSGVRSAGVARLGMADNAPIIVFTLAMLGVPLLVWLLRDRASYLNRIILAALPIGLFFALGGKLWVRFG